MSANTYVRARIDSKTKDQASIVLEQMGLTVSDAIRLLMIRVAEERRLPFTVKVPSRTTKKAIGELETGHGEHFDSVEELMGVHHEKN